MGPSARARLVMFPYGQPSNAAVRERCTRLLIDLGGDVRRLIDGPFSDLEQFIRYAGRLQLPHGDAVIVVLTRANPLTLAVINARRRIEVGIAVLKDARWVLAIDPEHDPFFLQNAASLGSIRGNTSRGGTWSAPFDQEYTVLCEDELGTTGVRSKTGEGEGGGNSAANGA